MAGSRQQETRTATYIEAAAQAQGLGLCISERTSTGGAVISDPADPALFEVVQSPEEALILLRGVAMGMSYRAGHGGEPEGQ